MFSLARRAPSRAARLACAGGVLLAACSDPVTAPRPQGGRVEAVGAPVRLVIPTYDGSGQAVHPDVLVLAQPWHGATHWMAVTPYPDGDAAKENPSLLASDDGLRWAVPDGVVNPVVPPPAAGHNSDPDLLYDAAGDRLVLAWREVSGGENIVWSRDSRDGRHWSAPAELLRVPSHQALSPALVAHDGRALLWYVDADAAGCRARSAVVRLRTAASLDALHPSSPGAGWSAPVGTTLAVPGMVVWHLDVAWLPARAEYWAVLHAYPPSAGCGAGDLYVARSRDGIAWEVQPEPVLRAASASWSAASLYRSSLVADDARDLLRVWLSGRARDGSWSLGFVELRMGSEIV